MKIKREKGSDSVLFYFRMLNVDKINLDIILSFVNDRLKYEFFEEEGNIIFDIDNKKHSKLVIELSEKFNDLKKSVYIGISSSYDHGGLSVPDYILEIIRKTNSEVDFSYILY